MTGKVAFDEYGDSTVKVITGYKVDAGKWVAVKTGHLEQRSARATLE